MTALEAVNSCVAQINREFADLDNDFEHGGVMSVAQWQSKRSALIAGREILTRGSRAGVTPNIEGMNEAEFLAYSIAKCGAWEADARERLEAYEQMRSDAARLAHPKDWHRTFRGIALDVDRAREQLARPGVFTDTHRLIEGIAHTPEVSTHGYALAMTGGEFDLPLPLLLSHRWSSVIGEVTEIICTAAAMTFKARIANHLLLLKPSYEDAGILLGYSGTEGEWSASPFYGECGLDIESIWRRITTGELAGISVDCSHLGDARYENGTKMQYRWRLCEISVCERGANTDARILIASERTGEREVVHRRAGRRAEQALPAPTQSKSAAVQQVRSDDDLAARIAVLEARPPTMNYRGVWSADEQYTEGDTVTDRGSMHYCLRSTRSRPGSSDDWKLCVKRGAAAKDAYQLALSEGFHGTRKEWLDSLVKRLDSLRSKPDQK